ncbi:MAG: hypothetical protein MHM6MM_000486 [Cercozoa sp. M6MM]
MQYWVTAQTLPASAVVDSVALDSSTLVIAKLGHLEVYKTGESAELIERIECEAIRAVACVSGLLCVVTGASNTDMCLHVYRSHEQQRRLRHVARVRLGHPTRRCADCGVRLSARGSRLALHVFDGVLTLIDINTVMTNSESDQSDRVGRSSSRSGRSHSQIECSDSDITVTVIDALYSGLDAIEQLGLLGETRVAVLARDSSTDGVSALRLTVLQVAPPGADQISDDHERACRYTSVTTVFQAMQSVREGTLYVQDDAAFVFAPRLLLTWSAEQDSVRAARTTLTKVSHVAAVIDTTLAHTWLKLEPNERSIATVFVANAEGELSAVAVLSDLSTRSKTLGRVASVANTRLCALPQHLLCTSHGAQAALLQLSASDGASVVDGFEVGAPITDLCAFFRADGDLRRLAACAGLASRGNLRVLEETVAVTEQARVPLACSRVAPLTTPGSDDMLVLCVTEGSENDSDGVVLHFRADGARDITVLREVVTGGAVSPSLCATLHRSGRLRLHRILNENQGGLRVEQVANIPLFGSETVVTVAAFSHTGSLVCATADKCMYVTISETGNVTTRDLDVDSDDDVSAVGISPDGDAVAIGLWKARHVRLLEGVSDGAVDPSAPRVYHVPVPGDFAVARSLCVTRVEDERTLLFGTSDGRLCSCVVDSDKQQVRSQTALKLGARTVQLAPIYARDTFKGVLVTCERTCYWSASSHLSPFASLVVKDAVATSLFAHDAETLTLLTSIDDGLTVLTVSLVDSALKGAAIPLECQPRRCAAVPIERRQVAAVSVARADGAESLLLVDCETRCVLRSFFDFEPKESCTRLVFDKTSQRLIASTLFRADDSAEPSQGRVLMFDDNCELITSLRVEDGGVFDVCVLQAPAGAADGTLRLAGAVNSGLVLLEIRDTEQAAKIERVASCGGHSLALRVAPLRDGGVAVGDLMQSVSVYGIKSDNNGKEIVQQATDRWPLWTTALAVVRDGATGTCHTGADTTAADTTGADTTDGDADTVVLADDACNLTVFTMSRGNDKKLQRCAFTGVKGMVNQVLSLPAIRTHLLAPTLVEEERQCHTRRRFLTADVAGGVAVFVSLSKSEFELLEKLEHRMLRLQDIDTDEFRMVHAGLWRQRRQHIADADVLLSFTRLRAAKQTEVVQQLDTTVDGVLTLLRQLETQLLALTGPADRASM